jgi:hypothetical protein
MVALSLCRGTLGLFFKNMEEMLFLCDGILRILSLWEEQKIKQKGRIQVIFFVGYIRNSLVAWASKKKTFWASFKNSVRPN